MPTKRELEREIQNLKLDLANAESGRNLYKSRLDDFIRQADLASESFLKIISVFGLEESYRDGYDQLDVAAFRRDIDTVYDNDRQIALLSAATKRLKGK